MKTSVGKYVSPQKLEMLLTQDELVEQVVVVGDGQPYVTALIVVEPEQLKQVVEDLDISPGKGEKLTSSAEVRRLLEKRLERIQQHLPSYEKVVDFRLLDEPFTMEEGTMTNTMKLRRNTIEQKYRHVIEEMYQG